MSLIAHFWRKRERRSKGFLALALVAAVILPIGLFVIFYSTLTYNRGIRLGMQQLRRGRTRILWGLEFFKTGSPNTEAATKTADPTTAQAGAPNNLQFLDLSRRVKNGSPDTSTAGGSIEFLDLSGKKTAINPRSPAGLATISNVKADAGRIADGAGTTTTSTSPSGSKPVVPGASAGGSVEFLDLSSKKPEAAEAQAASSTADAGVATTSTSAAAGSKPVPVVPGASAGGSVEFLDLSSKKPAAAAEVQAASSTADAGAATTSTSASAESKPVPVVPGASAGGSVEFLDLSGTVTARSPPSNIASSSNSAAAVSSKSLASAVDGFLDLSGRGEGGSGPVAIAAASAVAAEGEEEKHKGEQQQQQQQEEQEEVVDLVALRKERKVKAAVANPSPSPDFSGRTIKQSARRGIAGAGRAAAVTSASTMNSRTSSENVARGGSAGSVYSTVSSSIATGGPALDTSAAAAAADTFSTRTRTSSSSSSSGGAGAGDGHYIPPSAAKRRLQAILCTAVQPHEERYAAEWLDFHLLAGFDRIYMFDFNADSSLQLARLTHREDYEGRVFLEHLQHQDERLQHVLAQPRGANQAVSMAYNACANKYTAAYTWAGFLSVDEFLILRYHVSVKDLILDLHPSGTGGALSMNVVWFGSNGHTQYSSEPLIKRFTSRDRAVSPMVRSLMYLPEVARVLDGYPQFHQPNVSQLDPHGKRLLEQGGATNKQHASEDIAVIYRYHCKSYEEFRRRKIAESTPMISRKQALEGRAHLEKLSLRLPTESAIQANFRSVNFASTTDSSAQRVHQRMKNFQNLQVLKENQQPQQLSSSTVRSHTDIGIDSVTNVENRHQSYLRRHKIASTRTGSHNAGEEEEEDTSGHLRGEGQGEIGPRKQQEEESADSI